MSRYRLLPYWYTLFHTAATVGMPPMRPLWVHYPTDITTYTMEDQVSAAIQDNYTN
jgi:mannosyl-oligosaccharide alpha-1,3-glucosidase